MAETIVRPLTIRFFVKNIRVLIALRDEFRKVAGKAGSEYGKALDILGEVEENPRLYWRKVLIELHNNVDEMDHLVNQGGKNFEVTLRFLRTDLDFQEFLKKELSAMAGRLAKEAWLEYSQAVRDELLREGAFLVTSMRDQVVEYSQPRLLPRVEVVSFVEAAAPEEDESEEPDYRFVATATPDPNSYQEVAA